MWPISSCTKVRKCCNPHVYWWNRIGFKQSHFVEDLVATPRCMFLVSLFRRWDVVSLTLLHIRSFFIGNLLIYLYSKRFEHHSIASWGYHSVRSLTVLVYFNSSPLKKKEKTTFLLWFLNLKKATKSKGQTPTE
jgi:hypothetical protein